MSVFVGLHNMTADDLRGLYPCGGGIVGLVLADGTQLHWDSMADLFAWTARLWELAHEVAAAEQERRCELQAVAARALGEMP